MTSGEQALARPRLGGTSAGGAKSGGPWGASRRRSTRFGCGTAKLGRTVIGIIVLALGQTTELNAQVRIEATQVRPGVWVLSPNERSGNTLVVEAPEGAFIVDTMSDSVATAFRDAVGALGVTDVRFIANTHWHQNHVGGNAEYPDAVILGPERLRERLEQPQRLRFLVDRAYPALPDPYLPKVTFTRSITVHHGGHVVELTHVIGHTDTDLIVHFPDIGVVATGDLWSPNGAFLTDLDTGGSPSAVADALGQLLERLDEDVVIVTGHDRLATRHELADYVSGLAALLEYVEAAAEDGLSLEELLSRPHPAAVDRFIGPNTRMLEAAYLSLEGL